jgi:large subunit ribosomal protein L9
MQPIRTLGEYTVHVRLTMDLVPEVKITVHREGEALEDTAPAQEEALAATKIEDTTEAQAA